MKNLEASRLFDGTSVLRLDQAGLSSDDACRARIIAFPAASSAHGAEKTPSKRSCARTTGSLRGESLGLFTRTQLFAVVFVGVLLSCGALFL